MTDAQTEWLRANPAYQPVGRPRPDVSFREVGTLYADGQFVPSKPLEPIRLEAGCLGVGVPVNTQS